MLERLICAVLGHRYVVERVMNHGARKVGCTRCGKHWAMHDATRSFVPWDGEFEALYAPGGILAEASGDVTPNVGGEARLAAHQPSHTTTATPQGVASTEGLGRWSRSTPMFACYKIVVDAGGCCATVTPIATHHPEPTT